MASASGDCESFHARACSRPPDPTTRTFMVFFVWGKSVSDPSILSVDKWWGSQCSDKRCYTRAAKGPNTPRCIIIIILSLTPPTNFDRPHPKLAYYTVTMASKNVEKTRARLQKRYALPFRLSSRLADTGGSGSRKDSTTKHTNSSE